MDKNITEKDVENGLSFTKKKEKNICSCGIIIGLGALSIILIVVCIWLTSKVTYEKQEYIRILWNADYLYRKDSLEKAKLNVILFGNMANKEIEKKIKENDIFRICANPEEGSMHKLIQMKEFSIPKMDNGLTEETFKKVAYKDQFIKFLRDFEDIDIKNVAPKMYSYDEIINSQFKEFPIMVKLKNWYGAERTDNEKYLCAKKKNDITKFFANSEIDPTDYVFSEFIESTTEDSFHFVYSNKRFIRFRQTRKLSDQKFGITHFDGDFHSHHIVSDDNINPDIQEKLQKVLEKVNYRGIGCIDVKYRNDDFKDPVFLELNPRICGSMQTLFDNYGDWVRDWALL